MKVFLRIVEVVALFIAGAILARYLSSLLGLSEWMSQSNDIIQQQPVSFFELSTRAVVGYFIKYGVIFLLVALYLKINKVSFRKTLMLTRSDKSPAYLVKVGIALFCLAGIIPKFLFFLWPLGMVGEGPEGWQLLHQAWGWDFWLYMLITSIVVPPIVEELYFRGFMQTRLMERFSQGTAICIMAAIFTIFHTQYFAASIISIASIFSLFFTSVLVGYSRLLTGSIMPGLIAHALVNIPIIGTPALFLSAAMLIVLLVWRKKIFPHFGYFFTGFFKLSKG